ncbi:OsmC family protein [Streptomyces sp. S.PB5]|uniref:OsmC family protein n=1 Tax=Streptomyces sp. S.PB5 TaxID=3020844 RepID=UPI0025B1ECDA|nr:OsmC family protein [Streptomyces sp. S.PB5]MDN3029184.1 OsmC family protein [Streptomyces sp. S.PB5]
MTDTTAQTVTAGRPTEPEPHRLDVAHINGDAYEVDIRGHRILVDQPLDAGGTDTAPTPVELFAASLATCVAFYAGRHLRRHGLPRRGLRVRTEFTMASERPARVATVRLVIIPPPALSAQRHAALLAVASHCTIHNSLRTPPEIDIRLSPCGAVPNGPTADAS